MKAEYAPKLQEFGSHPDVHMISTQHDLGKVKYTPKQQAEFKKHIDAASQTFANSPKESYKATEPHTLQLKTYVNQTVRNGTTPNHKDFVKYLEDRRDKDVASVKTPAAQDRKRAMHNERLTQVHRDKAHFDNVLAMHGHLQKAKDVLTNALSSHSEFDNSIGGKKVKPEGFVVVRNNRPTKFVDRAEFSRANFAPKPPR
jgi:hypothetical protein